MTSDTRRALFFAVRAFPVMEAMPRRLCRALGLLGLLCAGSAGADTVLWSSGPLVNAPFAGPGGAHASTVQADLGLTEIGYGYSWAHNGGWTTTNFTDDFVVATPGGWRVRSVTVSSMGTGPARLAVFDGPPWDGGVMLAEGAAQSPTCAGRFRMPPQAEICDWTVDLDLDLAIGHYWVVWDFQTLGLLAADFAPPVTIAGVAATGDARIETVSCVLINCTSSGWVPIVDGGHPQGLPFVVRGRPASAVKGNFDGLASPEIVLRNVNPQSADYGRHKLWRMDGATRVGEVFLDPDLPGPEWVLAATDDFDTAGAPWNGPDGRTDALFQNTATGELQVWLLQGETRVGPALPVTGAPTPGPSWAVVAAADFNADGSPDLLWRNLTSQQLVIWTLNGTAVVGGITPVPAQAQHANWRVVAAQDYDDDGAIDLLWYNVSSGKVVVWYMDPAVVRLAGAFTTPASAGNSNWRVVASGDYSGGGSGTPPLHAADILWRNADSGRLVLWHLDFSGSRVLGEFTNPAAELEALDWEVVGPR